MYFTSIYCDLINKCIDQNYFLQLLKHVIITNLNKAKLDTGLLNNNIQPNFTIIIYNHITDYLTYYDFIGL